MTLIKNNQLYCYLIDDDEDDREFFASALQELDNNIKLETAESADQAIKHLRRKKMETPSYIFLDLNMAPVSGIECLLQLKNMSHLVEVPVIIYSTKLDEKIIYETLRLGAFDHIEKPSSQSTLVEYLKRLLQIA